ncbi:MAG TPA: hypothetical protein VIY27_02560 [Myxococcota bacterium]
MSGIGSDGAAVGSVAGRDQLGLHGSPGAIPDHRRLEESVSWVLGVLVAVPDGAWAWYPSP